MRNSTGIYVILLLASVLLSGGCSGGLSSERHNIIYRCDRFTVAADRLVNGDTTIKAVTPGFLACEADSSLMWKGRFPDGDYPRYESDQPLVDALYNRAIEEIDHGGVSLIQHSAWTTWLALCYINPKQAADTLLAHIDGDEIVSPGNALPWPVSSDRSAWILAAHDLIHVTGDSSLLKRVGHIASQTLSDDTLACRDPQSGLIYGSQTYLLPQPALYPEWMSAIDIYQSPCLGTNVVVAAAARAAGEICDHLKPGTGTGLTRLSQSVADAVKNNLWQPNLGYFSSYLYCYPYPLQLQATDNMAQALGIVFNVFTPKMSSHLMQHTPVYADGVPTMFPMPRAYRRRSSEAVQPLTQSMWTLAAIKTRNEKAFNLGFGALMKMSLTNDRCKYYSPGIVATIFRGFAGMSFEDDGISFSPYVPATIGGYKRIKNFHYRDAVLDIYIAGTGDSITSFSIDGHDSSRHFVPDSLAGQHFVAIELTRSHRKHNSAVNISSPVYMPITPDVRWSATRDATITNYQPGINYQLIVNGEFQTIIASSHYRMFSADGYNVVNFLPTAGNMWTGFSQQPYRYCPGDTRMVIDIKENRLDLHGIKPGRYMATLTYDSAATTAVGEITSPRRSTCQPVIFLPSAKGYSRSSAVIIDVGQHRELSIESRIGVLPHITKAVIIKL